MIDVGHLLEALGVEAKREGHNQVARCPFPEHDDRHPSFKVRDQPGNPRHGLYVCSCGRGGSPRTLVHDLAGILWDDIDSWLTEHGVFGEETDIEGEARVELVGEERKPFRLPAGVHFRPLAKWPGPARDYALGRGLTAEQVERWGIGYSIDGRLHGRIVIPIRGEQGDVQSYMARSFLPSARRYLTPASEENPKPGACFGAERWGAERGTVVLCEGALKCLAVDRVVSVPVAAVGGNQVQPDHIALLSSFERVVVLPDADSAGDGVAAQVWAALARWRPVVRLDLGQDADEVAVETLKERLASVVG